MQLILHPFDLPLRHVFTISLDSHVVQPTLIVELRDGAHRGFGEATTNQYYGVTIASLCAVLEAVRQRSSRTRSDPAQFWQACTRYWPNIRSPSAPWTRRPTICGASSTARRSTSCGGYRSTRFHRDFTIGIDTSRAMVAKLAEFPGWPIYKIKLGHRDDLEIVRELRKHTDAMFRVDANCGWTAETTIANAHELRGLNVEFIEQPLPADDWDGMKRVFAESVLPIIADESCIVEADVDAATATFTASMSSSPSAAA